MWQCRHLILLLEDVKLFGCYIHTQEKYQLRYQVLGWRRWCYYYDNYIEMNSSVLWVIT